MFFLRDFLGARAFFFFVVARELFASATAELATAFCFSTVFAAANVFTVLTILSIMVRAESAIASTASDISLLDALFTFCVVLLGAVLLLFFT